MVSADRKPTSASRLTPLFLLGGSYGERPSKRLPTSKRRDHDEHWFGPIRYLQNRRRYSDQPPWFWRDENHRPGHLGRAGRSARSVANVQAAAAAGRYIRCNIRRDR